MGYKPDEAKKLLAEAGFPRWHRRRDQLQARPVMGAGGGRGDGRTVEGSGHSRQDQRAAVGNKFWEVWDKVPFGFTEWTHRPLGLHGAGARLSHRRAVERVGLFQQAVRRTADQGRGHARRRQARARSSASSRRSCRRTGRSRSRCGGRSSSRSTRSSKASPPIPRAISSPRSGASSPDRAEFAFLRNTPPFGGVFAYHSERPLQLSPLAGYGIHTSASPMVAKAYPLRNVAR